MATKLKAKLDLDVAQATRKAARAKESVKGIETQAKKTGKAMDEGMKKGEEATDKFTKKIMTLGLSYLSLAALQRTITTIVQIYNKAIEAQREFTRGAAAVNRSVAPAASQFDVSENAMRELVGKVGIAAGAGRGDIGGISNLFTSAASTGLITGPVRTKGGGLQISKQDFAIATRLAQFTQRTGAFGQEADLGKLVKKGLGRGVAPTEAGVGIVLGQIGAGFRKSELSGWGEFLTGAISGTSGLLEEGVSFPTAIGGYAGLAKMTKSGLQAGETFRMLAIRFFTSDDVKMRTEVDRRYGKGTWWRLKKTDPDKLFLMVESILTGEAGPEQAKLFETLGVMPEQAGRISLVRGAGPEIAAIRAKMHTAPSMLPELTRWRKESDRAAVQAGTMSAAMITGAGGAGKGLSEAARAIADERRKEMAIDRPYSVGFQEYIRTDEGMRKRAWREMLEEEYKRQGWDDAVLENLGIRLGGEAPEFVMMFEHQRIDVKLRKQLSQAVQNIIGAHRSTSNVQIGVMYNNTPTDTANTPITRDNQ